MTEVNNDYALNLTLDVSAFLQSFSTYVDSSNDISLEDAWFNLTCDAESIAISLQDELDWDFFDAHLVVWSLFEDIISEDCNPNTALEHQVAALVYQWEAEAPEALAEQSHFALEVAFARLRGFSNQEAIAQQNAYLLDLTEQNNSEAELSASYDSDSASISTAQQFDDSSEASSVFGASEAD